VYWQFVHAIKGMGDACRKFNTPVTGGNVSFYNQNPDGPVYPTPTIGMVGLLENVNEKMTLDFKQAGDVIVLLGKSSNDINSSEYLHKLHGVEYSPAPQFDLEEEFHLQKVLADIIKNKLVSSAHDVSEGGLFVTLLESAMWNGLGFELNTNTAVRKDAFLFGEAQSRVVVSVKRDQLATLEEALQSHAQPYEVIGEVTAGDVIVDAAVWGNIANWKNKYDNAIANLLKGHESEHALSAL
jgi:phosphoribosylformylglycinamidine synthase